MDENNTFHNKYNMTYTLLQRLLSAEDFQYINTCEPVIIKMTEDSRSANSKKLKSPNYKHAVVSSRNIFIVNTPAKSETDLLLTISMDEVSGVQIIYDEVDFLQGELKKTAQHIQITCKASKPSITESISRTPSLLVPLVMMKPGTLQSSMTSSNRGVQNVSRPKSHPEIKPKVVYNAADDLRRLSMRNSEFNKLRSTECVVGSVNSLPDGRSRSNRKVKSSHIRRQSDGAASSKRPLPLPIGGTETSNALYMNKLSPQTCSSVFRTLSPSKSCSDITAMSKGRATFDKNNNLIATSTFSHSWNDVMKAALKSPNSPNQKNGSQEFFPNPPYNSMSVTMGTASSSSTPSLNRSINPTQSLAQSVSSKVVGLFKSNRYSQSSGGGEIEGEYPACDKWDIDIYTVELKSSLYNLIKESWMQYLLIGTYNLSIAGNPVKSSSSKVEKTGILQKFTELKEEILRCKDDDGLFLLTKEMLYACTNYHNIKKKTWKSSLLIKYYLKKVKKLVEFSSERTNNRMDEIDLLILVCEFFICIFQGSELFPQRNHFLNENRASFICQLIESIISPVEVDASAHNDNQIDIISSELAGLTNTWYDTCVALLYEVMNAASNSSWSRKLENRSFDVSKVVHCFSTNEKNVMKIVGHTVEKLVACFTSLHAFSSPAKVTQLYKELSFLKFLGVHCPQFKSMIKISHQEELKYHISKSAVELIPSHYPLCPVIKVLLPEVVDMFT